MTSTDEILARLVNLRDIASASPSLRAGIVLRSDAPLADDVHEAYGVAWPPATVIDLRDGDEQGGTHPFAASAAIRHLPLLSGSPYTSANARRTLDQLYLDLAASPVTTGLMVDAISSMGTDDGPILVHCSAGKDRTGITVALALELLGATREEVVADYLRTAEVADLIERRTAHSLRFILTPEQIASLPRSIHMAPLSAITGFLDVLDAAGGANEWFLAQGGTQTQVDALQERLLH